MSRLHNYKPLFLLFFFSFCFFAGGQIARLFPPASVRTDDKSPSGNATSSGTVPTASTSGNPLSTILPAAENWGLSFQEEGKVPVGNASFDELQQYHAYYAQKTDKKVIYLTFDCGYENGNTPAILNALKRHNVQATFFVVGNFLRDNPELVKQMLKEGHTIGNHTFHHPDMSQIATKETFSRELKSVEALYKDITGKSMTRFYRPPQGKYSTENLQMAKDIGYHTFFWSLAYVDWLADAQPSKEEAFDKLLGRIHPGAIVLLHNTSSTNGEILDELLAKCAEKAAKKQAKKKNPDKKSFYERMMDAQNGNVPTENSQSENINKMASSRLKSYVNPAHSVNVDSDDVTRRENVNYKPGSIGAKANIMLKYQNNSNDKGGNK